MAPLFRTAGRAVRVQLFDEVETLRGTHDSFDALVTVLNVGFERGGVVTRLERRGGWLVEGVFRWASPGSGSLICSTSSASASVIG